ncbi:hypothetical protein L1987_70951 [Smallanthus sonchifolius]|uniref:Uncharacterized protein n=1 Tax=Smallanthus sonchifolius TaxID=185202 RepID=A0ACB9ARX6_9ASTR|nr:hypothetical protein L1987_70951 [Smallanthus sonchifolius]
MIRNSTLPYDLRSVLNDENVYQRAASEAFPLYNKSHIICLKFPNRSGDVLVSSFSEISEDEYLDPRTAQVGKVDHVRQICTQIRPARDEELPSTYVEEYRCALDLEISKYVGEAYPKGVCSVYCTSGKDVEDYGSDFELVVVITATRHSPQNFWYNVCIEKDELLYILNIQVSAHYFEEGNVQLDAKHECRDSTIFQTRGATAAEMPWVEYEQAITAQFSGTSLKDNMKNSTNGSSLNFETDSTNGSNLNSKSSLEELSVPKIVTKTKKANDSEEPIEKNKDATEIALIKPDEIGQLDARRRLLIFGECVSVAQSFGARATLVNSWNITEVAASIVQALNMGAEERGKLQCHDFLHIATHTAQEWAEIVLSEQPLPFE